MINIGQPYIEKLAAKSRLCSKITCDNNDYVMWYEVDEKYEKYLCFERSDAFLICLLPYAMTNHHNISCITPVSEDLYYKLTTMYIPALAKNCEMFKEIDLVCKTDPEIMESEHGVGTGVSCGVDSFFTIKNNINLEMEKYNITHLTFFNVGSNGSYGGEKSRKLFLSRANQVKKFVHESNFEFVTVDSNISEFSTMHFHHTHTFRNFSVVFALQKLFDIYYYSSGHAYSEFKITYEDTAFYDLLTANCFSINGLDFLITGGESNRIEKIESICDYEPSHKYLNVCFKQETNCSRCEKCKRTMLALYAINKLDLYKDAFDVNYFKSNLNDMFGYLITKRKDSKYKEILRKMKENKIRIPIGGYFKYIFKHNFLSKRDKFIDFCRENEKISSLYRRIVKNLHLVK